MAVYLDYNASAPINENVLNEMIEVYRNKIGNADSRTHDYGDAARGIVEDARKKVASLLGVKTDEIFFTSGATESNNIAIQGLQQYGCETGKKHIITTRFEHKAILNTTHEMENRGFLVDYVSPDESGRVNTDDIMQLVRSDTLLVSVMHVNNETGIIQPVEELGERLENQGIMFHVDATQSCGKLVDEIRRLKYTMLSFSAHKLQGPQGIGVLVLRKKRYKLPPVKPIMFGGQQEHGISPGTVPVALVAGLGKACEISETTYKDNAKKVQHIKKVVLQAFEKSGLRYKLNGDQKYCIPSTINVCVEGVSSEALMLATKRFCGISNGSACTSHSYEPSYVLTAMGLPVDRIESSVRISWGPDEDPKEVGQAIVNLLNTAKNMAS